MIVDDPNALVVYVDEILADAELIIEELDPFSNGDFPVIYSVVSWLFPFVEESREWASRQNSPMALFDDEDDAYTPALAMKLILKHYRMVSGKAA